MEIHVYKYVYAHLHKYTPTAMHLYTHLKQTHSLDALDAHQGILFESNDGLMSSDSKTQFGFWVLLLFKLNVL